MNYIKKTKLCYANNEEYFKKMIVDKEKPYRVSFKFIRDSRRKFDYVNPLQTVQDLMVKNNWIEDDNCDNIIPIFEPYEYDKDNPGVIIKVL